MEMWRSCGMIAETCISLGEHFIRTIRISDCQAQGRKMMIRKSEKKGRTKANPMLEAFTTYELKAELRRRRREGGLLRWILWRLGRWA